MLKLPKELILYPSTRYTRIMAEICFGSIRYVQLVHLIFQRSDNVRLTTYSGPVDQLNENCSPDKAILLNCSSSENACVAHKIIFPLGIPNGPSSFARILMSINMTAFGKYFAD